MEFDPASYINHLEETFKQAADTTIAAGQKAYMRHQFEFYGIKSPVRREILRPYLTKTELPPVDVLEPLSKALWDKPQREWQYFCMELLSKFKKHPDAHNIKLYEFLITHRSWWDTIDFIAPHLVGAAFKGKPEVQKVYTEKWLDSGNIWFQRSAILFQLKYKEALDTALLEYIINRLLGSKEFFINKAIGWILREISKTNPDYVRSYVNRTALSNLSRREALKRIG
ncbi:MAG: DNA alkylation repair protein [Bacteroidetes bacterium]|nr:DNA alkylation repair protein [Bacteroidota bacterium]